MIAEAKELDYAIDELKRAIAQQHPPRPHYSPPFARQIEHLVYAFTILSKHASFLQNEVDELRHRDRERETDMAAAQREAIEADDLMRKWKKTAQELQAKLDTSGEAK